MYIILTETSNQLNLLTSQILNQDFMWERAAILGNWHLQKFWFWIKSLKSEDDIIFIFSKKNIMSTFK